MCALCLRAVDDHLLVTRDIELRVKGLSAGALLQRLEEVARRHGAALTPNMPGFWASTPRREQVRQRVRRSSAQVSAFHPQWTFDTAAFGSGERVGRERPTPPFQERTKGMHQ